MDKKKRKLIYTNREHSQKGIFSSILALLSFATLIFLLVKSYKLAGVITGSFGATAFLCTVFSIVGIVLGALGKQELDKYYLFNHVGIGWNVLNLLIVSGILYAGT